MKTQIVLHEIVDHISILTLNHTERRNALSRAMLEALRNELEQASANRAVKAVILRAAGTVFSSGHDLRELVGGTAAEYEALFALCTQVMECIRNLPHPVIAQVQGVATAAGCQLVATCDLVVASEQATFATPGVKIGLFCTTPGVALCRAVPPRKALEMLLTGAPISAHEAERIGLVSRVVPANRLAEETMNLARQIVAASAETLGIGKRAFYQQLPLDHSAAYTIAQRVMVDNAQTADAQEGMRAFLQKRAPRWEK